MSWPISQPLLPREKTRPNSLACFEYTQNEEPPAHNQELKDKGNDATFQVGAQTERSWEQRPWQVKDTIPNFMREDRNLFALYERHEKQIWVPVPTNFHDLVQIFKDYGVIPRFYNIPHVMAFPEFAGYPWQTRWGEGSTAETFPRTMRQDQGIFYRIVFASCRTGRVPLCAPDYFFLPSGRSYPRSSKKAELYGLFRAWNQVLDSEWIDQPEEHVDWKPFCEWIRGHLPTAEFLFGPLEVWDKTWFARTITEKDVKIPVRAEIVDLAKAAGYEIEIKGKKGWFGKQSWSLSDEAIIREVALRYWFEWRERSEHDLERLESPLVEL